MGGATFKGRKHSDAAKAKISASRIQKFSERTHCHRGHAFDDANTMWRDRTKRGGRIERACRECMRINHRAYKQTANGRAKITAAHKRKRLTEKGKAWRKTENHRARLKQYGLTSLAFDRLWKDQSGKCAICEAAFVEIGDPQIDHLHGSKLVRGLLCKQCNLGIGHMRDDAARLESAGRYLRGSLGHHT